MLNTNRLYFYVDIGEDDVERPRLADTTLNINRLIEGYELPNADFSPEKCAIAIFDSTLDDETTISQLYKIVCQAVAFGLVPTHVKNILLFPGHEKIAMFSSLADTGYPVFFDNHTGRNQTAFVKDQYLMASSRDKIANPPKTDQLLDLIGDRMIADSCVDFVYAIAAWDLPHLHDIAKRHQDNVVAIATQRRLTHTSKIPQWRKDEFEKTAANNVQFLETLIKYAIDTDEFEMSCEIDAVAKIWRKHLMERHMGFLINDESLADMDMFLDTAKAIGIDDSIAAYYDGIPLEDILA